MSEIASYISRDLLSEAFGGNLRLIRAFEDQAIAVSETQEQAGAAASATEAIQDATVLTLSSNASFSNERVFTPENGIQAIDEGSLLKVGVDKTVARVSGGHDASFLVTAPTTLLLPVSGTLATREGVETLTNKSLDKPKLASWGNFVDDVAAGAGGVPVGGVYRNGSVVMVRAA